MKNKFIIVGTLLTLTMSGFGYVGSANAEGSVDEKKENVSLKLNSVETDILNASKKINEINLDISSLESSVQGNQEEITRVTKEAKGHKLEVKKLEKEIISLEEEIEARNEILKERLSSYQNSGGDVGFIEVIFGSKGFEEFITRFTAVTTITKADNKLVEDQKNAINKVEVKEGQVKEKLIATEKTKEELTEINKNQKIQKKELTESKKSVESKVSDLEVKKSAYIAEGNDLEALEQQIEEEIRATEAGLSEDLASEAITSEDTNTETTEASEGQPGQPEQPEDATSSTSQNSTETKTKTSSRQPVAQTSTPRQEASTQAPAQTQEAPTQQATSQESTQAPTPAPSISKPKPKPTPTPKPKPTPPKPSGGKGIISDAHALTGTKYKLGGTTTAAFDCSGYTSFVYKQNGINLPRTASQQYAAYPKVSKGQLRAGDLVFFSSSPGGGSITHVGISLGGSQFIGSQSSTGVAVTSIDSPYYWGPRFVGGARPN